MLASDVEDLRTLLGRKVRATMEFSGIPKGTVGTVVRLFPDRSDRKTGVMVRWTTAHGTVVDDGFGRDADFDETNRRM